MQNVLGSSLLKPFELSTKRTSQRKRPSVPLDKCNSVIFIITNSSGITLVGSDPHSTTIEGVVVCRMFQA